VKPRSDLDASPLGRATHYPERYDPRLLFAVDRAPQRAFLGFDSDPPLRGADVWTAYEVSWLDAQGKPQIGIATFEVPAQSPRLVESKSVKLYVTSFNQTRFASASEVSAAIARDLSQATGATVAVTLALPRDFAMLRRGELAGECLDEIPMAVERYELSPESLAAAGPIVDEALYSRLFLRVCPVTGQPAKGSTRVSRRPDRTVCSATPCRSAFIRFQ
jgi:7-cyano-7-deazaguanine reductase